MSVGKPSSPPPPTRSFRELQTALTESMSAKRAAEAARDDTPEGEERRAEADQAWRDALAQQRNAQAFLSRHGDRLVYEYQRQHLDAEKRKAKEQGIRRPKIAELEPVAALQQIHGTPLGELVRYLDPVEAEKARALLGTLLPPASAREKK